MKRSEKFWHPNFIAYMKRTIAHPNYKGLPFVMDGDLPRWIATAKSPIGQGRKQWAEAKARQLGIPVEAGVYAKVMHTIHPTKQKVCQICGETMSIDYIYPNAVFTRHLLKTFSVEITIYDSMYTVWDTVIAAGHDITALVQFLNQKFGTSFTVKDTKEAILEQCEVLCRIGGKSHFGPGAMSNFPDRYDGFHTYNRCCRSLEDKGRSKENLKSYSRDRRAYEYWSDGNIHAANMFMGSGFFDGASADHIGPISLGFVHDPRYLRALGRSDNSSKRDRLTAEMVDEIVATQHKTNVYPVSWYSAKIWEYIVANYQENRGKVATEYRALLKQSMSNYMFILQAMLGVGPAGQAFLNKTFILPRQLDFSYRYTFNQDGTIRTKTPRNITERAAHEFTRFATIAFEAVHSYNNKENRNVVQNLTSEELSILAETVKLVQSEQTNRAETTLRALVDTIQTRLLTKQR